jgi:hypothetical protein
MPGKSGPFAAFGETRRFPCLVPIAAPQRSGSLYPYFDGPRWQNFYQYFRQDFWKNIRRMC